MTLISIPDKIIHPDSLGDTINALNSVLFYELPISQFEKAEAAQWIASRQGLPRSYVGMFAPTAYDYTFGAITFTGEIIQSSAGTGHLLSEEACRLLHLIGDKEGNEVQLSLRRARRAFLQKLEATGANGAWSGVYCCGTCSAAMWRHFAASRLPEDEHRLENGMIALKRKRDGQGRWKQFPFYYTLLALSEIHLSSAQLEIRYALPAIERALRRVERSDPEQETEQDRRRRILLGRILQSF